MNTSAVARLVALGSAGGIAGAFLIGGPLAILGGVVAGGVVDEIWAKVSGPSRSRAHGTQPRSQHARGGHKGLKGQGRGSAHGEFGRDWQASFGGEGDRRGWQASFGADASGVSGLRPNQHLLAGQSLASPSGRFLLALTTDGEAVLYDQRTQAHIWSSETPGSGASSMVMAKDGNLVLLAPDGATVWSSGTSGQPGARLTIHDDGNLAVYSTMGIPIWQSHTPQSV